MILHLYHGGAHRVQQSHLGLRQVHLLDKRHQIPEDGRRIWQEPSRRELKRLHHIFQLSARGDANHQIIQWILLAKEMLEDLINGVPIQLVKLDGDPLSEKNGDPPPEQVVPLLLDLYFRDKRVL